jgi:hypothetical protein
MRRRKEGRKAVSLYDDVVKIAKLYLGPAAERFVTRQVSSHLNKAVTELTTGDLEELAKWCFVSGRLVMPEERAKQFGEEVRKIKG